VGARDLPTSLVFFGTSTLEDYLVPNINHSYTIGLCMVLASVDWLLKFKIIFRFNFSFFEMQDSLD
jgi:hypothetical protein